jgi:hypothetical protein
VGVLSVNHPLVTLLTFLYLQKVTRVDREYQRTLCFFGLWLWFTSGAEIKGEGASTSAHPTLRQYGFIRTGMLRTLKTLGS